MDQSGFEKHQTCGLHRSTSPLTNLLIKKNEVTLSAITSQLLSVIPITQFSSFNHLKRVTAWIMRFVNKCQKKSIAKASLSAEELERGEIYWLDLAQTQHFLTEIETLQQKGCIHKSNSPITLQPFLDSSTNILRVVLVADSIYLKLQIHILNILSYYNYWKGPITHAVIRDEHQRLLHAGQTPLFSSLSWRYHIVGGHKTIRSVTRECLICRQHTVKPKPQILGQLLFERITPGPVFDTVGVHYAGPFLIKYGHTRKPTIVKSYVCVFFLCQSRQYILSLSVVSLQTPSLHV